MAQGDYVGFLFSFKPNTFLPANEYLKIIFRSFEIIFRYLLIESMVKHIRRAFVDSLTFFSSGRNIIYTLLLLSYILLQYFINKELL